MNVRNITGADLNLFVVLQMLLAERSVSRAAERLGLTQSAVSRSLGRLRALFGNALFERTSHGMTPTRRAIELAAPVARALGELERLLAAQATFDPATATRRFRIAAVDAAQVSVLSSLVSRIAVEAPRVDVEIRQPSLESERELESGALDLLLAPRQPTGPAIVWAPLYDDDYTCVVWKEHPARRLTLRRFTSLGHVLVAPRDRPGGIVDAALARSGLSRRVAVQVPTFLVVPHMLVGTEHVATIPVRIAVRLTRTHPLRMLEPPLRIPGFTMSQAWHEIHRDDPGHRWLRATLGTIAGGARMARTGERALLR